MTASPTSRPPAARGTRRTTVDADEDVWEELARQPEPRVKPRRDRRHRASCRSDGRGDRRELRHRYRGRSGGAWLPRTNIVRGWPTSARRWTRSRARNGVGGCSVREAIDVQARGSGTRALRADPRRARGREAATGLLEVPADRSPQTRNSRGADSTTRRCRSSPRPSARWGSFSRSWFDGRARATRSSPASGASERRSSQGWPPSRWSCGIPTTPICSGKR